MVGDQHARAGIFDNVGNFVRCQPKVDRQEHRADVACGKGDIEKCRAVLHQHGDDIALANAARCQPAAHHSDALVKSCVGNFLTAVFQRTAVGVPPGMKRDEAR